MIVYYVVNKNCKWPKGALECSEIVYKNFNIAISLNKLEVLQLADKKNIQRNGINIRSVNSFNYLGTAINKDATLDGEISSRLKMANDVNRKLSKIGFNNNRSY